MLAILRTRFSGPPESRPYSVLKFNRHRDISWSYATPWPLSYMNPR